MESKCYAFRRYKKINKLCLVYLQCKLNQDRYGGSISKLKFKKKMRKNIIREKEKRNKVPPMFLDIRVLAER